MRAYVLEDRPGLEALSLIERPDPTPGPGQALIGVKAVALNYRDLLVVRGTYADGALPLGSIPVSDGAGEVIAVGKGVTRVRPGDRVAATFMPGWISGPLTPSKQATSLGGGGVDGMLAERVVLDAEALVVIPPSLSFEEAATLPCAGVTAWYALFVGGAVQPGHDVLLLGTGGVSIFALQFAKAAGARVILTSSSAAKLEYARSLGADVLINYTTTPEWDVEVLSATKGLGVDHAVEVGGPGTLNRTLNALKFGGSMSLMGVLTGLSDQVNTGAILHKNIRIQGTYVGSREMFETMVAAITVNRLSPVIDQVFPFIAAPAAYAHLEAGRHFGKVVIRVAD
jgi:NADPH:quinone reductase-like Zn-dependent oxidoreductase